MRAFMSTLEPREVGLLDSEPTVFAKRPPSRRSRSCFAVLQIEGNESTQIDAP
jgi:hypothetical protein